MSGRGGGGGGGGAVGSNGKGNTGISGIPAGSRKMVQSLKEIVNNCTEQEIYAMLKDCNMDPNESVNRLLAQGHKATLFLSLFVFRVLGFEVLGLCYFGGDAEILLHGGCMSNLLTNFQMYIFGF